ncbi:hypothetical protein EXS72_00335 [Candidatus Pacearchaeota archaeon]|nr:hypothetical protein [Candidatus Pacearchaeota archaeon]
MVEKTINEKQNYYLIFLILIGATIRIYFLNLVKNQAHWWDSLAYGSLAKNMIYHKWDDVPFLIHESIIRPPLLPLIWSWLIRIGSSDYAIIFITNIIPSIISIYLIYLIAKEMYGSTIGIFSAIFASISWIYLFYSARALTDIPSMFLALASIYFFIKSYELFNIKFWSLSVFCLALSVLFRYSYALFALIYIIFLIFIHKTQLIKKKKFWLGGILGATPIIFFIIFNLISYGSILPAAEEYTSSASEKTNFAWYTLSFINHILRFPMLILFYIGGLIILLKTIMSYGLIGKFKESKMHVFNLLLVIISLSFYIFFLKASEDRYLLGISSALFIFSAIGLHSIFKILLPYNKKIAFGVCIFILIWSIYSQILFANTLILDKKESYRPMKDAFNWVYHNTPENTLIAGDWAEPYAIYYSERKVQILPQDLNFSNFTLEADYVILTAVHSPNEKVGNYVRKLAEDGQLILSKVFFFDEAQKNPAVVIYKRK